MVMVAFIPSGAWGTDMGGTARSSSHDVNATDETASIAAANSDLYSFIYVLVVIDGL